MFTYLITVHERIRQTDRQGYASNTALSLKCIAR